MTTHKKLQPEIRFAGFTDDWEQRELSDIVERVTRKNINLESLLPLTISAQDGLVSQTDFFDKQVASKNISGYYLIEKGEFAYNKSYSSGYPWGAIKRLEQYDNGVLSTLYILFRPINVISQFLVSYFDTNCWHSEIADIAVEGARNHGLLNIPVLDFFKMNVTVPISKEEQTVIGNFFKQLDDTIALHQRELEKFKILRKSYLKHIFIDDTTQFRVEKAIPWEQRKLGEVVELLHSYPLSRDQETSSFTGLKYIHYGDIHRGKLNVIESEYYLPNIKPGNYLSLDKGDIVVADVSEDYIGIANPCVIHCNLENKVVAGLHTIAIRPKEFNPLFLYYLLFTDIFKEFGRTVGTGTKVFGITAKNFLKFDIVFPTEEEQTQIGNFFKQLDDAIALHQKELEKYQQIKEACLEKMFV